MSQYVTVQTQIRDQEALFQALEELGFRSHVETHAVATGLVDYRGMPRPERAEVIIRRRHLKQGSNDMGFVRQPDGTFRAIISDWDIQHGGFGSEWLKRLRQTYAVKKVEREARLKGMTVARETLPDKTVKLVLRRYA